MEYIKKSDVINITAETGALETQNRVTDLPTITLPTTMKMGKWELLSSCATNTSYKYKCSSCSTCMSQEYNFCPNCGATMEMRNSKLKNYTLEVNAIFSVQAESKEDAEITALEVVNTYNCEDLNILSLDIIETKEEV